MEPGKPHSAKWGLPSAIALATSLIGGPAGMSQADTPWAVHMGRLDDALAQRNAAEAKARRLYLAALFRSREQNSVDGVLRAAQAFAALGDGEVVEVCLSVAQDVAAQTGDPQADVRVHAFRQRLMAR
ncbi:MAG: hypothetical protein ACRELA_24530 [Candidatus Rokuibacteriota bacterium]